MYKELRETQGLRQTDTNKSHVGTHTQGQSSADATQPLKGPLEQEGQSISGRAGGASSKVLTVQGLQVTIAQAQEAREFSTPPSLPLPVPKEVEDPTSSAPGTRPHHSVGRLPGFEWEAFPVSEHLVPRHSSF